KSFTQSRGSSCLPNSRRAEQAENSLLLDLEAAVARADDAQMARPEILDRTSVEVLLDDSRADVRGARDRGRVAEPLGHPSHAARHRLLLRRHAVRRPAELRERDRRLERPAPGPEILRREFLAHLALDVLVELPARQVAKLAVELVAKELPPAGNTEQLRDPGGDPG